MPVLQRSCDRCDVMDEGPRHVVGLVNAAPGTAPWPLRCLPCCAAAGCRTCLNDPRTADLAAAHTERTTTDG